MRVIQAILGHSSVNVTERYSHLQPEVMEKAKKPSGEGAKQPASLRGVGFAYAQFMQSLS